MLVVAQIGSLIVWVLVALWLSGSLVRDLSGRAIRDDGLWALNALFAYWVAGYRIRQFTGVAPNDVAADQIMSAILMHVAGIALACALMWKRHKREGLRW